MLIVASCWGAPWAHYLQCWLLLYYHSGWVFWVEGDLGPPMFVKKLFLSGNCRIKHQVRLQQRMPLQISWLLSSCGMHHSTVSVHCLLASSPWKKSTCPLLRAPVSERWDVSEWIFKFISEAWHLIFAISLVARYFSHLLGPSCTQLVHSTKCCPQFVGHV